MSALRLRPAGAPAMTGEWKIIQALRRRTGPARRVTPAAEKNDKPQRANPDSDPRRPGPTWTGMNGTSRTATGLFESVLPFTIIQVCQSMERVGAGGIDLEVVASFGLRRVHETHR